MHKRLALALTVLSLAPSCAEEEGPDLTVDGGAVVTYDASLPGFDAGFTFDAGATWDASLPFDASVPSDAAAPSDAGATDARVASDGSAGDASAPRDAGGSDAGVNGNLCPGSPTPHGCYKAKAGNPMGCPAQIFEQSAFYPPIEEWKGCSSPYYTPCIYLRPDNTEANCSCDLGLHWLCTY